MKETNEHVRFEYKMVDGSGYQNGWIFRKVPKGGKGSFSIQKFMLHISDLYMGLSSNIFRKKCKTIFLKWGGGGQRPFGNFPKLHQFWKPDPSLSGISPLPLLGTQFSAKWVTNLGDTYVVVVMYSFHISALKICFNMFHVVMETDVRCMQWVGV